VFVFLLFGMIFEVVCVWGVDVCDLLLFGMLFECVFRVQIDGCCCVYLSFVAFKYVGAWGIGRSRGAAGCLSFVGA